MVKNLLNQEINLEEAELHELIPEGIDLPADIPAEIFTLALQTYLDGRRVDMRALAADLGISRRTLYRKVRDRNQLLGEIHWYNSRLLFAEALAASRELKGAARVVAVYEAFVKTVSSNSPPLEKALRDEPENTLRVITTKHGPVHGRVRAFIERLLQREIELGHFKTDLPLDALSFAIVRMGESFLYADVLTGEEPDINFSVEMVSRLLRPDQIRPAKN
ncbi:MAG: QsdR family transcriptional regulator [Salinisphaeraceae bacterium]|nr:QsdR family transcriptional regulator [Salinisphaeraceae bacterium]